MFQRACNEFVTAEFLKIHVDSEKKPYRLSIDYAAEHGRFTIYLRFETFLFVNCYRSAMVYSVFWKDKILIQNSLL